MKDITGDLWDTPADWRCITTNGSVRRDGRAVMGRGCAYEAKQKFPDLDLWLGDRIRTSGNQLHILEEDHLIFFPVKHQWMDRASLSLIETSAMQLALFAHDHTNETILLPRPGCGNGRLLWTDVGPLLQPILPDNVWIISHAEK